MLTPADSRQHVGPPTAPVGSPTLRRTATRKLPVGRPPKILSLSCGSKPAGVTASHPLQGSDVVVAFSGQLSPQPPTLAPAAIEQRRQEARSRSLMADAAAGVPLPLTPGLRRSATGKLPAGSPPRAASATDPRAAAEGPTYRSVAPPARAPAASAEVPQTQPTSLTTTTPTDSTDSTDSSSLASPGRSPVGDGSRKVSKVSFVPTAIRSNEAEQAQDAAPMAKTLLGLDVSVPDDDEAKPSDAAHDEAAHEAAAPSPALKKPFMSPGWFEGLGVHLGMPHAHRPSLKQPQLPSHLPEVVAAPARHAEGMLHDGLKTLSHGIGFAADLSVHWGKSSLSRSMSSFSAGGGNKISHCVSFTEDEATLGPERTQSMLVEASERVVAAQREAAFFEDEAASIWGAAMAIAEARVASNDHSRYPPAPPPTMGRRYSSSACGSSLAADATAAAATCSPCGSPPMPINRPWLASIASNHRRLSAPSVLDLGGLHGASEARLAQDAAPKAKTLLGLIAAADERHPQRASAAPAATKTADAEAASAPPKAAAVLGLDLPSAVPPAHSAAPSAAPATAATANAASAQAAPASSPSSPSPTPDQTTDAAAEASRGDVPGIHVTSRFDYPGGLDNHHMRRMQQRVMVVDEGEWRRGAVVAHMPQRQRYLVALDPTKACSNCFVSARRHQLRFL